MILLLAAHQFLDHHDRDGDVEGRRVEVKLHVADGSQRRRTRRNRPAKLGCHPIETQGGIERRGPGVRRPGIDGLVHQPGHVAAEHGVIQVRAAHARCVISDIAQHLARERLIAHPSPAAAAALAAVHQAAQLFRAFRSGPREQAERIRVDVGSRLSRRLHRGYRLAEVGIGLEPGIEALPVGTERPGGAVLDLPVHRWGGLALVGVFGEDTSAVGCFDALGSDLPATAVAQGLAVTRHVGRYALVGIPVAPAVPSHAEAGDSAGFWPLHADGSGFRTVPGLGGRHHHDQKGSDQEEGELHCARASNAAHSFDQTSRQLRGQVWRVVKTTAPSPPPATMVRIQTVFRPSLR